MDISRIVDQQEVNEIIGEFISTKLGGSDITVNEMKMRQTSEKDVPSLDPLKASYTDEHGRQLEVKFAPSEFLSIVHTDVKSEARPEFAEFLNAPYPQQVDKGVELVMKYVIEDRNLNRLLEKNNKEKLPLETTGGNNEKLASIVG